MDPKDLRKWNIRFSAVYALGVWTMLGSFAFLKYTGRYDPTLTNDIEEPENPNKHVYRSAHLTSEITYKPDFVPYTTRIYRFLKSFREEPEPEPRQEPVELDK